MKKAYIVYSRFFDYNGDKLKIGGIEKYILYLSRILNEIGYGVSIYQFSDVYFEKRYENIDVYGVKTRNKNLLYKEIEKVGNFNNDLLIFASEYMNVKNKFKNSIAIQHGIAWDYKLNNRKFNFLINSLKNYFRIKRFKYVKKVVCVDYNFVNWYRAITQENCNYAVIPNFSENISSKKSHNDSKIKIIFARRFEFYRGTKLFSQVVKDILTENSNVEVTFAGEGTDEKYLRTTFQNFKNVNFIKYQAHESSKIHSNFDIAVVPSIASEGTSLAVLEAMSAGCAVVATNVGGITNIIIDNYNGLLANPEFKDLKQKILMLIKNKELRERLSLNAIQTIKFGFSYEIWKLRWIKVINDINNLDFNQDR